MSTINRGWFMAALAMLTAAALPSQAADNVVPGKIIISGATGQLGHEVVDMLLAKGVAPSDLILVSRSPDKLKELADKGASVRMGDFDKPETLADAFKGGQRLLLISSQETGPKLIQQNLAAIDAAKQDRVQYVVYTSFVNAQKMAPYALPGHYATEQALAQSGMQWTAQRNQDYQDNVLDVIAPSYFTGKYTNNFAPGKAASVSKHDCAAVSAALLASPSHQNQAIEVTGPRLLSTADVARLLSEITGKPIQAAYVPDDTYKAILQKTGLPESRIDFFVGLGRAQHAGVYEVKTSIVKDLTGHEPMSEKAFLQLHKDEIEASLKAPPR